MLLAAGFALAACSGGSEESDPAQPANPLIHEIADADGAVRGWLMGTIHALPDGVEWRTPAIARVEAEAGLLIVEIADFEDRAASARTFGELATTPGLPPLPQRIAPSLRDDLAELMAKAGLSERDTGRIETWAAALMLARVQGPGSSANGVDRALVSDFAGRPVRELEGTRAQLAIFDALPEADQRDLLREVVAGAADVGADPEALSSAWLVGDEAALVEAGESGILADPGLREALLVKRNRAWRPPILAALDSGERPLVAVGAAHVVGPDGLAALLEAEGYTLTRLH
ncbi:TraB/GumN family protein [Erythrobacter sp.]|uniref:TraB/GumN family protein n=1 Tax=Erythrobacter sp. TaxID=1042 RepID=UPI0025C25074|nr:TraB/GumN family protein [Erythrobacter sp.]